VELRGIGNLGLARTLTPDESRIWLGLAALFALTLLRLLVAAWAPLAPDEAYYWVWSRALAPGYLDHPPMVAAWIRAGTLLAGPGTLGVRLLAPIAAGAGSLLLAQAAHDLLPPEAGRSCGLTAAAILNATLLFGVGAVMMTPDTPLLFFWAAAIWALGRLHRTGNGAWWLAAGAACGLALCSKYTAALLAVAVGLWLVSSQGARRWLFRPDPYAGLLLAGALFAPTLAWNARHGWASFARQGGRVRDWNLAEAARHIAELIGGQIGLATPLVFLLCAGGIVLATRRVRRDRDPCWMLLALLTAVPATVFLEHALGDRVQANWPAIMYPSAAIAAAALTGQFWTRLRGLAIGFGVLLSLAVYLQGIAAPLPLPRRLDPTLIRLGGWTDFAAGIEAARRGAGAGYIAAESYGEASELARLVPPGISVVGIDPRWQFFALPNARALLAQGSGLLVETARHGPPDPAAWQSIRELGAMDREREGIRAESYRIYRVSGPRNLPSSALLPMR
jgi:4-amino-4-deoxy-L-arabinose transferase-like glycosyltransferase